MLKKTSWFVLILIGLAVISNCSVKKLREEFYQKKKNNELTIVFKEVKIVQKKKAVNLVFARYLNTAPSDSLLLDVMNQYTLYYLYERGFTNLFLIEDGDEFPETTGLTYEVELTNFIIKEFKHSETVSDSLSDASKTFKLKGIKTSIDAIVTPIVNGEKNQEFFKIAKSSVQISESQEGQFAETTTIKDIIVKNKNGSTKYLSEVNRLSDGVFESECIQVAEYITQEIGNKMESIYVKTVKAKK